MAQNTHVESPTPVASIPDEPAQRPAGFVAEWRGQPVEVHFSPGRQAVAPPAIEAAGKPAAVTPAQAMPHFVRRCVRVDWYALGVVALMITSAVVAVIRCAGR